jgi:hypothetical protein
MRAHTACRVVVVTRGYCSLGSSAPKMDDFEWEFERIVRRDSEVIEKPLVKFITAKHQALF